MHLYWQMYTCAHAHMETWTHKLTRTNTWASKHVHAHITHTDINAYTNTYCLNLLPVAVIRHSNQGKERFLWLLFDSSSLKEASTGTQAGTCSKYHGGMLLAGLFPGSLSGPYSFLIRSKHQDLWMPRSHKGLCLPTSVITEGEAGGSVWVQSQSGLYSEFQASGKYIMRPCLKKEKRVFIAHISTPARKKTSKPIRSYSPFPLLLDLGSH